MSAISNQVVIVSNRWSQPGVSEPPNDSVVGTPDRRSRSLRRTAHINATWPLAFGGPTQLAGRARDLFTPESGQPIVVAEDEFLAVVDEHRTISAVSVSPHREGAQNLVGASASSRFRASVDSTMPGESASGTPLSFLLDDVGILSFIGGIAWSQHRSIQLNEGGNDDMGTRERHGVTRDGRIICSGLRPDGYHDLSFQRGISFPHYFRVAGELTSSDDPWASHLIDPAPAVCMRRRRRIDAWIGVDGIELDAHFRDSIWGDRHTELSLHEYSLQATIDIESDRLISIDVVARVLPFPECPGAAKHVRNLIGLKVDTFRTSVPQTLRELECCTHLNDMLRGLAEIPGRLRSVL